MPAKDASPKARKIHKVLAGFGLPFTRTGFMAPARGTILYIVVV